jgi:two-component system sensor histidine kinase VicK
MITWFSEKTKTPSSQKNDDFVAVASHELRSPLSVIKWYTEILLDEDAGELNETQKKYLSVIELNNQRAIDLVRSLLNVSRLDLDTFSISPELVSLEEVIEEQLASYANLALKKNIKIEQHTSKDVIPAVLVDKHLLALIVREIITNAINFSRKDEIISVEVSQQKECRTVNGVFLKEDTFIISFKDQGIGIPKEDIDKIFEKMSRASNSNYVETNGSGLGLYIVRELLKRCNGYIWCESTLGKGSTFYVAIPKEGMPKKEGRTTLD